MEAMLMLMPVVVSVLSAPQWTAAAETSGSKPRRGVTQSPAAAVYQGLSLLCRLTVTSLHRPEETCCKCL